MLARQSVELGGVKMRWIFFVCTLVRLIARQSVEQLGGVSVRLQVVTLM